MKSGEGNLERADASRFEICPQVGFFYSARLKTCRNLGLVEGGVDCYTRGHGDNTGSAVPEQPPPDHPKNECPEAGLSLRTTEESTVN